jgi:hypothetical protein
VNTFAIKPVRNGAGGFVLNYSLPSGEITYVASSRDTKNTIEPLTADTATVYQLAPKTFIYNTDPQSGTHVGYIAEEVYEVNPVFASYCELNGPPVAISFDTIQVYMLEEMKKLRAEVNALKLQLASGGASVCSTNTPPSSGEEAASAVIAEPAPADPVAPAEDPAAPAEDPAAPAEDPVAPAAPADAPAE